MQEKQQCERCQLLVEEEELSKGLCEDCYSDMYEEWQLATKESKE